mgnify:FL=1
MKIISTFSVLQKPKNISKKQIFASIFVLFLIALIVIMPSLCINSIYNGLSVWAKCVLPSLLPFMFFTKLLTSLQFISTITSKFYKVNCKLFNAPKISSYIFFMSIISGYPVGAKLISEYYKMGFLTPKQANKLCTFCSTSGPLFVIGTVGTSLFLNTKIGYIMFFSHIASSLLNGLLFRRTFIDNTNLDYNLQNPDTKNLLFDSMKESILSVLLVGGYIAVAFLIIDVFNALNILYPINFLLQILGLNINTAQAISSGIIEVSKGCVLLAKLDIALTAKATIASFLIGFGGISVFLQTTTFLQSAKVNLKFYALQKLTHGIISAILTFLLCLIFV